ncbi:MAG: caspase domain-containing protein [Oligoflexales bacterium]
MKIFWCLLILVLLSSSLVFAELKPKTIAILVASPESFDPDLPTLKYAFKDVERIRHALIKVGRLSSAKVFVLDDPTIVGLEKLVNKIKQSLKKDQDNQGLGETKLIFYYTGHSDIKGLHFFDRMLTRSELHRVLDDFKVKTKVIILDSCYSGALAEKGIKPAGAFTIPKADFDEPHGTVFMTATSGSELAFEIDEIEGSLFTHHIVKGMYGLADLNRDGFVTIDELYQFVYKNMKLQSLTLPEGVSQSPEFNANLKGKGALVLTAPKMHHAQVVLDKSIIGSLTFSNEQGIQIYQVDKPDATSKQVSLVAGEYQVYLRSAESLGTSKLLLIASETAHLSKHNFVYDSQMGYHLMEKGKREDWVLGYAGGVTILTFTELGPHLELRYESPAIYWNLYNLRFLLGLSIAKNKLQYQEEEGDSFGVSAITGLRHGQLVNWGIAGQLIHFGLIGGLEQRQQEWENSEFIEFKPQMPKFGVELATSIFVGDYVSYGLGLRREWLFVEREGTKDTLAFAASSILFSLFF